MPHARATAVESHQPGDLNPSRMDLTSSPRALAPAFASRAAKRSSLVRGSVKKRRTTPARAEPPAVTRQQISQEPVAAPMPAPARKPRRKSSTRRLITRSRNSTVVESMIHFCPPPMALHIAPKNRTVASAGTEVMKADKVKNIVLPNMETSNAFLGPKRSARPPSRGVPSIWPKKLAVRMVPTASTGSPSASMCTATRGRMTLTPTTSMKMGMRAGMALMASCLKLLCFALSCGGVLDMFLLAGD
mmetsp:Transcript_13279/g.39123  ORF Transcript_13279/g.39123 Transcript_13279/m.39123 type:complete len:246 (-) Transcript_13279:25-762(-)